MVKSYVRYGAIAAMIGAGIAVLMEIIDIVNITLPFTSTPVAVLRGLGFLLLAIGVWSLHAGQALEGGKLSLAGVIILSAGDLILAIWVLSAIGTALPDTTDADAIVAALTAESPLFGLGTLFILVGSLVFGVSVIRAKVFPSWTGFLLLFSLLAGIVILAAGLPVMLGHLAEGLGFLSVGLMAWQTLIPLQEI